MIKIGIKSGRIEHLLKTQLKHKLINSNPRKHILNTIHTRITISKINEKDIPIYFKTNTLDCAIIGLDNYIENNFKYKYIKIPLFNCGLYLIGNKNQITKTIKPLILTKYIKCCTATPLKLLTQLKKINGAAETCILKQICNYIIDIVDTGTTLHVNKLKKYKKIKSIYSILILNKNLQASKLAQIKDFLEIKK